MPWLVRFKAPAGVDTPPAGTDTSAVSGLFEEKAMLISKLWDLGTTGVVERETDLVAGFARLDAAQQALQLAGRHDMLAEVESVDDSWVRHDPVKVTISTEAGAVAIPIVAGAAFGHGGHPTTRLCLDLMGRALARQKSQIDDELGRPRVLDLGTGSGVLAIAAERLGARSVTASDVDPAAIDSARFNVVANGVDADLVHGDIDTVTGRAEDHGVRFDLIVANVLIGTHEQVSWSAVQLLRPDGCLVIAGFLADQTERAISAYRSGRPSLQVVERVDIDGWCGLSLAVPPGAG